MTLLTDIKDKQLIARKAKDEVASSLLTTLYSEAAMTGKNATPPHESTDAEVIATIKKFLKNTVEFLGMAGDRRDSDLVEKLDAERTILEAFLPKQLSDAELTNIMQSILVTNGISGPKGMGILMKLLKEQYDGLYDGKVASAIAKQLLV